MNFGTYTYSTISNPKRRNPSYPKITTQTLVFQIIYHILAIIYSVFTFFYNKISVQLKFLFILKLSLTMYF